MTNKISNEFLKLYFLYFLQSDLIPTLCSIISLTVGAFGINESSLGNILPISSTED